MGNESKGIVMVGVCSLSALLCLTGLGVCGGAFSSPWDIQPL